MEKKVKFCRACQRHLTLDKFYFFKSKNRYKSPCRSCATAYCARLREKKTAKERAVSFSGAIPPIPGKRWTGPTGGQTVVVSIRSGAGI